jgi:small-conductance mechanosensitive channel
MLDKANEKIKELEAKGAGGGDDLEAELAKLRSINKELIDQRDAQKKKEDDAEALRLAEQGEFKELSEKLQTQIDELTGKLETSQGQVSTYVERDEVRFKGMLEKIPENLRDTLDDSIPLPKRLELAEKLIGEKPKGPGVKPAGNGSGDIDLSDMSPTERLNYARENGLIEQN